MKNLKIYIGLSAIALSMCLASCSDDDEPSYSSKTMADSALKTILLQKGYQFNASGNLYLDDLARNTTVLDLSGTRLEASALSGLDIFPNLTEVNLADNGYGETFDFSVLPAQITGVDLTGNEIYNYDNLVNVTVEENGDEIVENLHNITKLYLPEEAKYNIVQLMRFYRQNKSAIDAGTMDVKMADANGNLQKYNTLREVPDEILRNYLKTNFASIFTGDNIDISKHFNLSERNTGISIYDISNDIYSLDGIEFIINHPEWKGTSCVLTSQSENLEDKELPYLKIGNSVTHFSLSNIKATKGIDFSEAEGLLNILLGNVGGLKSVDISSSKSFGQRDYTEENEPGTGSCIAFYDCPDLEEVFVPNAELKIALLHISNLSSLKTFDMSHFIMIPYIEIGDLSDEYNLVYPNLTIFHDDFEEPYSYLVCTQSTLDRQATKDFINKYYPESLMSSSRFSYGNSVSVRWTESVSQ